MSIHENIQILIMYQPQESQQDSQLEDAHTQPSLEVLKFKSYSSGLPKHLDEVLLFDKKCLKKSIGITHPTVVYVNHQTSMTKVLPNGDDSAKKWPKVDQEGFSLLLEIHPNIANGICKSFTIARHAEICLNRERDLYRSTFIVLGCSSSQGAKMKLRDKDVIKLGRECYVVRLGQEGPRWYDQVFLQKELLEGSCRICLTSESSHFLDYLISPCNCTGSLAFVHIECLRMWISNQVIRKRKEDISTYTFKKHACEVCRSELPKYISIQGHMIELVPFDCDRNSLILQKIEFQGKGKLMHCVKLNPKQSRTITIGRNEVNDIQLQDLSVSRNHAKFVISQDGIQLYDCNSKYGTFLMLKDIRQDLREVCFMSCRWSFQLSLAPNSE